MMLDFTRVEPTRDELIGVVRYTAVLHGLSPALMFALVEQESAWNPWGFRYERNFYTHYLVPHYSASALISMDTELRARATSWGLFQVLGETAREIGFARKYLAELIQPDVSSEFGCMLFAQKLLKSNGDVRLALLSYNGGGNPAYPDE